MGVATLTHGGLVHRLRCDPNDISWSYSLKTKVEETYGGRVVQILSVRIEDLTVEADSGSGRWEYLHSLLLFCRDVMFQQKATGQPATFSYPPRGWTLKVFLTGVPYSDNWQNVKYSFTLQFKVQEDVTGVLQGDTVVSELNKIKEGIGYERNDYNYPQVTSDGDGMGQGEQTGGAKEGLPEGLSRPRDEAGNPIQGPVLGPDGKYY